MKLELCAAALLAAFCSTGALAGTRSIFNDAKFVEIQPGLVELDGFGRGANTISTVPTLSADSLVSLAARVSFFDTWNIQVGGVTPGTYSFQDMVIDATGSLLFGTGGFAVTFNSIDEAGVRNTVLFDVNAGGTQAVGSGTFTVRNNCPIASCVWIDLTGTQDAGNGPAGYGGTVLASVVPEPASYALFALGLAAVGALARRRRAA